MDNEDEILEELKDIKEMLRRILRCLERIEG